MTFSTSRCASANRPRIKVLKNKSFQATARAQFCRVEQRAGTALDEAKERHDHELTTQRMRFEALQARAAASEKLLGEAREHLLGRADEIRTVDRRAGELALERDTLQTRIADLEKERIQRESEVKEVDQARATLMERRAALTRAFTAKEAALTRAEDTIAALNEQIAALEASRAAEKQVADQRVEELSVSLRREQMQCSVWKELLRLPERILPA